MLIAPASPLMNMGKKYFILPRMLLMPFILATQNVNIKQMPDRTTYKKPENLQHLKKQKDCKWRDYKLGHSTRMKLKFLYR